MGWGWEVNGGTDLGFTSYLYCIVCKKILLHGKMMPKIDWFIDSAIFFALFIFFCGVSISFNKKIFKSHPCNSKAFISLNSWTPEDEMKGVVRFSNGEVVLFLILMHSDEKDVLAMTSCFHEVESGSLAFGTNGATI